MPSRRGNPPAALIAAFNPSSILESAFVVVIFVSPYAGNEYLESEYFAF